MIVIPESVAKWAAEIALIDAGLDTLPQTYFQSLAGKNKKKAEAKWAKDPILNRNSPMLLAAISAGVITAARVETLMIAAKAIETA